MRLVLCSGLATLALLAACERGDPIDYSGPVAGWDHWGGTAGGLRYSPLTQIKPGNVQRLEVAWTYHIGTLEDPAPMQFPTLEVTAVLGDGRLYLCSPLNRVVALDPETGREIWSFDPRTDLEGIYVQQCRGVTFHRDDAAPAGAGCASRVLAGTLDGRLVALDAARGTPCEDFGAGGTVDLREGLGEVKPGDYALTSPPVVVAGRIVLGGHIVDNARLDVPAGVVRAFDLHTGALSWAWNSVPPGRADPKVAGTGESYIRGTANAWSVFSVDHERGLVFVPTGNTSPDLYGG
ncbi:MAG: PQQ-binding-like beta-propeller repeat protein, partial [Steroidobacteraceae bacterium]|nr:PQQ-binding-like beta-propeller repeat protein [Steroidobacteraceae bacterium]